MNSTTDPKAIEPDDVLVARADERLVHAYDQIARADEQLARLNEQLSKLEHDAPHHPSAVVGRRPPRGRPALRGFIALLLAVCIFVGAFVLQSSYGGAAKLIVARWAPQPILTSSLATKNPGFPALPSPSTVQVAAATPVLLQPTPSAQTAPQGVAPTHEDLPQSHHRIFPCHLAPPLAARFPVVFPATKPRASKFSVPRLPALTYCRIGSRHRL